MRFKFKPILGGSGDLEKGRPSEQDARDGLTPLEPKYEGNNPDAWTFVDEEEKMPEPLTLTKVVLTDPPWLARARKLVGTKEGPGAKNNPVVVNFWIEARMPWFKDDATAWCAGFANAELESTGFMGTRKANAKSFLEGPKQTDAKGQPRFKLLNKYRLGAVCVLNRPPYKANGHVGFVVSHDETTVTLLGGNQGDSISYAKFPKSRVAGLVWPYSYPLPLDEMPKGASGVAFSTSEA